MRNIFIILRAPAIISLIVVLPFMSLELINRQDFHEDFPIPLFGILWFLPVIFILILMPIVRNVQAGNKMKVTLASFLVRVAFLILLAWFWVSIILDQMPCFLGVRNCD